VEPKVSPVGDVFEDFHISFTKEKFAQVPEGATEIKFMTNDEYVSDNTDPNHDVGVVLKITILKVILNNPDTAPPGICSVDSVSNQSTINMSKLSLSESLSLTGTSFSLNYLSDRAPGYQGSPSGFNPRSLGLGGWMPSIFYYYDDAGHVLYSGDGGVRHVEATSLQGGGYRIPSPDGGEIYYFNPEGFIEQVRDSYLNQLHYSYSYDEAHRLTSISDTYGNTTLFNSLNSMGTQIISPYGQVSDLSFDSHGWLKKLTSPKGEATSFTISENGLLAQMQKPMGQISSYEYDVQGRLLKDKNPLGGYLSISGAYDANTSTQVSSALSALGIQTNYSSQFGEEGSLSSSKMGPNNTLSSSFYDKTLKKAGHTDIYGGENKVQTADDPRFGAQAPYVSRHEYQLASDIYILAETSKNVELENPGDPLSLRSLTEETVLQNNPLRKFITQFKVNSKSITSISPLGRKTTQSLNNEGEIKKYQVGSLEPIQLQYDERGRVSKIRQGERFQTLSYDDLGELKEYRDELGRRTKYRYDLNGRIIRQIRSDGSHIDMNYDANGNLISLTPSGKEEHNFAYNALDYVQSYLPPALQGSERLGRSYAYDLDKRLTQLLSADGENADFIYDNATGFLSRIESPEGNYDYYYKAHTDLVEEIKGPMNESLKFSYLGAKPTEILYQGSVNGLIQMDYDSEYRLSQIKALDGMGHGSGVTISYDLDGLPISIGELHYEIDSSGILKASSLGKIKEERSVNSYGELSGTEVKYRNEKIYSLSLQRDLMGRVVKAKESAKSDHDLAEYGYDPLGRLIDVRANGDHVTYKYDANGNRLEKQNRKGKIKAQYDEQDRLIKYGNTEYVYNANGDLGAKIEQEDVKLKRSPFSILRRILKICFRWWGYNDHHGHHSDYEDDRVTEFDYDLFGNLRSVVLPDGKEIEYIINGQNQRIGKKVNGVIKVMYLYQSETQIAAELNAQGRLISQFIYGSKAQVPEYMIKEGKKYKFITDHLGSVRMLINIDTGKIEQRMDYDEFGMVLEDTHPGFQPFGFAGGLYDQDTKLVRFGARDYDPEVGRWTSKDPILFNGGDTNLYGYVISDPINFIDRDGKNPTLILIAPYLAFESGFFIGATINKILMGIPYSQSYRDANPLLNLIDGIVPTSGFFLDSMLGQSLIDIFKHNGRLICE
jgi:RHS repeat-associated protein